MATKVVQRRNVIVVGKTGAGKSTVANKISGHDNFEVQSSVESSSEDVSHIEVNVTDSKTNVEYVFKVIDTVGFFDTNISNQNVLKKIKDHFQRSAPEGVSLVLFVFKRGRFTKDERKTFEYLKKHLKSKISNASALVITNCDGLDNKSREDEIRNFMENDLTKDVVNFMTKGIYAVGFPDLKGMKAIFREAYEEDMKTDEEKLRRLVMDSSQMHFSKELFEQSFWDSLNKCTIL